MAGKVDLHMHTHWSDGAFSPRDLLTRCSRAGLTAVSITDHDSVASFPEAAAIGQEMGIEVITGVELSVALEEKDVHILGYFVDYTNMHLQEALAMFRKERLRRAERIVEKLNGLKYGITLDAVMQRAGNGAVGRPHIAMALVDAGLIPTYQSAFDKLIGNGAPAFEKKFHITPADAVKLIASAGGLSFLAHPGRSISEDMLKELIKSGLDGIEVIHPAHSPELVNYYRGVVNTYYLLESGGSDFHGGKKNDDNMLGSFTIDESRVSIMKSRLFPQ